MPSSISDADLRAVLAADDKRRHAMTAGDADRLSEVLADGLVHIHASGRAEDKAAYLVMFGRHPDAYHRIDRLEANVTVRGDTAWMTGTQRLVIVRDGRRTEADMRFLSVWSREAGAWRMAAFSTTRVSA